MRLDRSKPAADGGKYGLIKNRELEKLRDTNGYFPQKIADALLVLVDAGILDWGCTPETEFFVIRLKDKYAEAALRAYANEAELDDQEFALDVGRLSPRAGPHSPFCKRPD